MGYSAVLERGGDSDLVDGMLGICVADVGWVGDLFGYDTLLFFIHVLYLAGGVLFTFLHYFV
jgi:hypothetical protein